MLRRSNEGKNKPDNQTENRITLDDDKRRELFEQNAEAREIFERIQSLRQSVNALKESEAKAAEKLEVHTEKIQLEESEEILAAKKAIIEQAKKDAEAEALKKQEILRKEQEARENQQRLMEAQRLAALRAEEAERKRQEAIEAEKRAKETARRVELEAMDAERQAKIAAEKARIEKEMEAAKKENSATPEEIAAFFDEAEERIREREMEAVKAELMHAQRIQNIKIDSMSHAAEINTEMLAGEQHSKLAQQQKLLKAEQEKIEAMLEEQKRIRLETIEHDKAELKQREQEREQQAQLEELMKAQEVHARRAARLERAERKRKEKAAKLAERERLKQERRARKEAEERAKLEQKLLIEKSKADAEIGGGVVNVQGVTINTKIKDTLHISWKDVFGIRSRKEKNAQSEHKRKKLQKERENRTEEARALLQKSLERQAKTYNRSKFGKTIKELSAFCEKHKTVLLTGFSIVLVALVGTAGVFNYCTAYEYSYNGKSLGIVRNKDDVLQITDLVQGALTEEKNVNVVIDAKDDISFKRVSALGDVKIDTSEEVLKRLTYMGDLNVKAYGIYVDGKKAGSVASKDVAAEVIQEIKDKYSSGIEGSEIEEAVFIEDVEVTLTNTDLQDVASKDEMVDILCTSGEKESLHKVIAGETLADIAKLYSMEEKEILDDNAGVDPKKLVVGSTLVIKQNAPILTVKITELLTYDEVVEFKTVEKDDDTIYEGYTETEQKGKDGLNEVTSRFVYVNGEEIEENRLVTTVKEEPVEEIILIGTKERPPTVGSGKYIWPLEGGYTFTSGFKPRWGSFHKGIDLGVSVGTNVIAADGGTVTQAGYSGSYGYLVVIDHQNGMETYYAHNDSLVVSVGDKVFQGQHIAESGNTGRSTGPHLHFEIRVDGEPQNPLNYLPD